MKCDHCFNVSMTVYLPHNDPRSVLPVVCYWCFLAEHARDPLPAEYYFAGV